LNALPSIENFDVVLIDGDHTYEGVRRDLERFGRRVREGGAVLVDDVFPDALVPSHPESAGRLVREVVAAHEFRLVKRVDRLAHLTPV
jgi:predicted O-methyltransferase YrrM